MILTTHRNLPTPQDQGFTPAWLVFYASRVGETVTFLFTDIAGSTALLQRVGESAYAHVLAGHHAVIRSALAAHHGREIDTQGDAFFAVFSSARNCVAAAIEMQLALEAHPWPGAEQVRVRMGMHCGEAEQTETVGLVGLDIHRAARIAAVGHGGQVLASDAVATLVRDRLPPGATLRDLGVHRLKDLGRPERIFQLRAAGLLTEFPPLRSMGNPALLHNLPTQPTPFIGRARELAELVALIGTSRLVTLTGAGGCGKTRLALQVAAGQLDGSGDGVWLVELAAVTDPETVALAVCDALRIAAQPGQPALDTLTDALVPLDALIVLDNCEHVIGACAKTADAVLRRCPRVHLIATSREPLGIGGEAIYRVPPMSLPDPDDESAASSSSDATALLIARASVQGITLALRDPEVAKLVNSVCRRLDALPLAIELAAARLRSLSLSELHSRLDQRFRLLTGGSPSALERQQTLRATVSWSYSLLNGPEQILLRRLSALASPFELRAAEEVCGFGDLDPFDVAGLLGSLVDKSLVVAERDGSEVRYRLLETIRQFAAEHLAGAGEAAAVAAAHCAHFLAVAERAAPHLTGRDQIAWFRRLDVSYANLFRALEYAAAEPDGAALVLRFAVALRSYWGEARPQYAGAAAAILVPILDRTSDTAKQSLLSTALVTGMVVSRFVDIAAALRLGQRALESARALGDERQIILALSELGGTYWVSGAPEKGLPLAREAVERARRVSDDVVLAESLIEYLLCADQDPAGAEGLYAEAIACTERSGHQLAYWTLHNNAGILALYAEDLPTARAHMDEAQRAMHALSEDDALLACNLGWLQRAEGDSRGARLKFEEGFRLSRRNGDRAVMSMATLGLACLATDLGANDWAARLHGGAQALRDSTGLAWGTFGKGRRAASMDQARFGLGDERFERAYAQGISLSIHEIVSLASQRAD
jgi:predicted ATPase/class 3 adenylate cyclase